jgi:acetoacetyl-CoA reductase
MDALAEVPSLRIGEAERRPLAGQVAIVTGGSRGIGSSIARELAECGATTVVNYLERADDAREVCAQVERDGGSAIEYRADVARRDDVRSMVERVIERYGKVDILINNAGILRDRAFKNMTDEEWDAVIQTDLTGVYNMSRAVAGQMIAQKSGCIVTISSIIGQTGNFGQANYAAAKAGIIGLTRTLAQELARYSIRVNAICPGFVDTEMWRSLSPEVQDKILARIPLGRVATPLDVARAVRYLIVDGSYVTGQTLNINGGLYLG